ncbi:unnamed protein product [Rotaria sordida]|uniref:Uncharacterized protein n=1 Tax=Rotaria sordida TaxID=392033 RepID=A0A815HDD4_9BILA|nr:unnamed protein product [Rotaria sordida]CAF1601688.1 unnamed protein product [Rotaria sordida]
MALVQSNQQLNNNNNKNNNNNMIYWHLIQLLDVSPNGRFVLPFSRRLILIDRPFENENQNRKNKKNETSTHYYKSESEFSSSSSLSEDCFQTDDENNDDNDGYDESLDPTWYAPSPFDYDPYDSYDWES